MTGLCPEIERGFALAIWGRGRPGDLPVATGNREFGRLSFFLKKKAPRTPKERRFFASGNLPTPGCLQMPPMLLRGRPRTYVGYGRHTRPGARPFRYAAAVVGLVTGRRLALSGKVKSRIISGHSPPKSRYVTIRAGQKHTKSYEPRKCAEDNAAVKAASDRRTSVSHRPQKSAFLSGSGGLSLRKQQRKPPELPGAICGQPVNRSGVGHPPARPGGRAMQWRPAGLHSPRALRLSARRRRAPLSRRRRTDAPRHSKNRSSRRGWCRRRPRRCRSWRRR